MRITGKSIHTEENHSQVVFQTNGTTRLTIDGSGVSTWAGAVAGLSATNASLTTPTVTSITSASASLTGTIQLGGASDLVGFFGATPVAAQSTTATTAAQAFVGGGATAATSASQFSGNTGSKKYTVGDIVSALKAYGILAS